MLEGRTLTHLARNTILRRRRARVHSVTTLNVGFLASSGPRGSTGRRTIPLVPRWLQHPLPSSEYGMEIFLRAAHGTNLAEQGPSRSDRHNHLHAARKGRATACACGGPSSCIGETVLSARCMAMCDGRSGSLRSTGRSNGVSMRGPHGFVDPSRALSCRLSAAASSSCTLRPRRRTVPGHRLAPANSPVRTQQVLPVPASRRAKWCTRHTPSLPFIARCGRAKHAIQQLAGHAEVFARRPIR